MKALRKEKSHKMSQLMLELAEATTVEGRRLTTATTKYEQLRRISISLTDILFSTQLHLRKKRQN